MNPATTLLGSCFDFVGASLVPARILYCARRAVTIPGGGDKPRHYINMCGIWAP